MKINIAKFCDGFVLAIKGIGLAMRELRFWVVFFITFLVFGVLLGLLSGGFASFQLMGAVGIRGSVSIIFENILGIVGYGRDIVDVAMIDGVAILQALLIGTIAVVAKKKKETNSENLERAGLVTGLMILGTGCPTCGTALLTPILGAIFAGGGAIAGTVSWTITALAIIIAILSLRKVGEECYVIIVSEKYKKRNTEEK